MTTALHTVSAMYTTNHAKDNSVNVTSNTAINLTFFQNKSIKVADIVIFFETAAATIVAAKNFAAIVLVLATITPKVGASFKVGAPTVIVTIASSSFVAAC